MFSAVANFLFGSQPAAVDRPEEEAVDYEVNEAEDWLLVDVSDNEGHDYEVMDDVDEADDVLSCVPQFLSSATGSILHIDASVVEAPYPTCEESWLVTSGAVGGPAPELPVQESFESGERHLARLLDERVRFRSSLFSLLQSVRSIDLSTISCLEPSIRAVVCLRGDRTETSCTTTYGANQKKVASSRCRTVALTTAAAAPYPHKTKPSNRQERTRVRHTAAISGAFIDHQPPFVISKVELLEQIKQLKPAQQARERDIKKHVKKAQMDRQNKAYQFETTNKNRRRKDFYYSQRNSGANNNRKC